MDLKGMASVRAAARADCRWQVFFLLLLLLWEPQSKSWPEFTGIRCYNPLYNMQSSLYICPASGQRALFGVKEVGIN